MKYSKQFRTSLIVLGFFLIFVPIFCYANGAIGAFFLFPPATFLFASFVVWTTEALVIKNRLDENPKKALLAAFLINSFSTIFGYLLIRFFPHGFTTFLTLIIILFIGTVIVEGILLSFFYPKSGLGRVLITTFLMNILSYVLLFASLSIGTLPFFGTILDFVIIFYLAWRIFGLFKATKELPTGEKISIESSSDIKYVVLAILITLLLVALYIDTREEGGRPRARDARIQSDLTQARSIAEMILNDEDSYESLCDNSHTLNKENLNYGSQLKILEDDIMAQLQETKKKSIKPACFASVSSYCISTVINGSSNYICIDAVNSASGVSKPCSSADKCPAK